MKTLLLDRDSWDLCLDIDGNIAVASDPYALSQDAASAIRLFQDELWYDRSQGVPYFSTILGKTPSRQFMKGKFEEAALTVAGVVKAECFFTEFTGRALKGQVQITSTDGTVSVAAF